MLPQLNGESDAGSRFVKADVAEGANDGRQELATGVCDGD